MLGTKYLILRETDERPGSHHVSLALDGPQLEGQTRAQRIRGRDHRGPGEPGGLGDRVQVQADEIREEQEEAAALGGESARRGRP